MGPLYRNKIKLSKRLWKIGLAQTYLQNLYYHHAFMEWFGIFGGCISKDEFQMIMCVHQIKPLILNLQILYQFHVNNLRPNTFVINNLMICTSSNMYRYNKVIMQFINVKLIQDLKI